MVPVAHTKPSKETKEYMEFVEKWRKDFGKESDYPTIV